MPDERLTTETAPLSWASVRLTWLLVMLSVLSFEAATGGVERTVRASLLIVAIELGLALSIHAVVRRFPPLKASSCMLLAFGASTVVLGAELFVRGTTNSMLPFELILLSHLRNVVLVLAALAQVAAVQRHCCSLSTFLAIFAGALAAHLWLQGLTVLYAIVGIWWLMGTHWESLQSHLTEASQQSLPRRWLVALPAMVLTFMVLVGGLYATTGTRALRGFMPSSGGSDWYDPAATSGVGDGDALVAGTENIQSFGPIEDAPFLNSHEPSLYDLFDDTYNEPVAPRQQDRAIALAREFGARQKEQHLPTTSQAGKQFSTVRKLGTPKQKAMGDRPSSALFYVKGRVPLHLKLEVFDRFDGVNWFPEPLQPGQPAFTIEMLENRPWLRLPLLRSMEIHGAPEVHALKIVHLDTNRIPSPTQLMGVHIDQLDRPDFFLWSQPGQIRMDREKLPATTVMHLQSRVVDVRRLPRSGAMFSVGDPAYREFGTTAEPVRIQELVQEWTKGVAHGWPQIETVISRLRENYIHDRTARPAATCQNAVNDFLLKSHRGTDYQFASAAVIALRTLGYSARLVSGFHVQPSRFDRRAGHTPVLADDVHVWAEVNAGNNCWIPLEPTPGYDLLPPPPTYIEQLQAAFWSALHFAIGNWMALATAALSTVWILVYRHDVVDAWHTLLWRMAPAKDERQFVLRTVTLLDARCRRAGHARPSTITPTGWVKRLFMATSCLGQGAVDERQFRQFLRAAEWAYYSPMGLKSTETFPAQLSKDAVRLWTVRRLRMSQISSMSPAAGTRAHQPPLRPTLGRPISPQPGTLATI